MRTRRDERARRSGGLLLAVVLIVSQASAWFHAVAITHVACAEHGEAVHGRAQSAANVRAVRPDDTRAVSAEPATAAGHDHCGNAALLRWRDVALTAPAAIAALVPDVRSTGSWPVRETAYASAVYRLAPKTSPPLGV
jgi:hypothetical protein